MNHKPTKRRSILHRIGVLVALNFALGTLAFGTNQILLKTTKLEPLYAWAGSFCFAVLVVAILWDLKS